MITEKKSVQNISDLADVKIDGNRPWDIQVNDDRFYRKLLSEGSIGLGESYMDGWWDCSRLDEFFDKILSAKLERNARKKGILWAVLKAKLLNMQSRSKAFEIGEKHYDIGNNLYKNMLDQRMVYTCGYWKKAKNLDEAQENKLNLVCKKVRLKKDMKVLDVGCGWGSFVKYAAEKYTAKVVGITVSEEQTKLARKLCKGLDAEIRLQDYRDVNEKFDAIVSLGMFEHVGPKNYRTYMKTIEECLEDDGLFLLHTIGGNVSKNYSDRWINKYIFPGAVLPSVKQIADASEGKFILRDWHNFGKDYDRTLMAWNDNFQKNWNRISDNYDGRFKRMWEYYLLSCAGSFRAGKNQLWQIVFSKEGKRRDYVSVR